MPLLENSATDDQILLDGDTGFTGGQASNVRRNLIKEGAFTAGKNIDYDVFGNLVTRRGASQETADAETSRWDDEPSTYWKYTTGTAEQTGYVVTGTGTAWTIDVVGMTLTYDTGPVDGGTVTGFTSATEITVSISQTVDPAEAYTLTTTSVWGVSDLAGAIISASVLDNQSTELFTLAEYDGASVKNIRTLEEGSSMSAAIATFSGTDVYFAQLSDRMYWWDGVGALQYITTTGAAGTSIVAGKVTSITITEKGDGYDAVPTVAFTGGGGSSAAGTAVLGYKLGVVRVDMDVEGTGYSYEAPPTVSFTAPTSGTTATGVANVSQLPSEPKLLTSHTNRLFCCSADTDFLPDQIFVSGILDGESWDIAGDQIRVTKGDGDPIVALSPWYDFKLVVLKERSIWVVDANPSQNVSDWTISLLSDRVGCVSHKSVQQVGADVYFLSREGIQSVSNIEAGSQAAVQVAVSAPIDDFINRINQDQWGKCASAYYGNRYMLSLPLDDSTIPNVTLVYNTLHKSWSGYWTGWEPRAFAVSAFGGKIRLNFGDEEGKFYTWRDYVHEGDATVSDYMDDLDSYDSEVISRGYNFKEMYSDKLGYQVEFDLENFYYNQSQEVKFYYLKNMSDDILGLATEGDSVLDAEDDASLDGWSSRELLGTETISNRESHFIKGYNLLSKNKFKEIQFVAQATSGRLALQAVKTSAFPDTIDPQR